MESEKKHIYKNILDKNMEKQKKCRMCNIFTIFSLFK
jgi:hypothetical protein